MNSVPSLQSLQKDLKILANPSRAIFLQRFFKTRKGEYAHGDVFLGIVVPESRKIARRYNDLSRSNLKKLLVSKIHEERLVALFILVHQFQRGDEKNQKAIYRFYLQHTAFVNNWDLVDLSADKILGEYLFTHPQEKSILPKLARSKHLWEKRIAMIATYAFFKHGKSEETFRMAKILLHDPHDLIHKAVGWMLREAGKRVSLQEEKIFLHQYATRMPRTALRYAIEKFSEPERQKYLAMGS